MSFKVVRIMPLVAVAALVLSFVATSRAQDEVYSVNVVGFQKVDVRSNGLSMVSTPFSKDPDTLDDVIGQQLTAGKAQNAADEIVMWNPTNQAYVRFWRKTTDGFWYTDGAVPVRATNSHVETDMGFWTRSKQATNQTVVMVGDVVDDVIVTNPLLVGLNMVSYPFSTEINANQSGLTNGLAGKAQNAADEITLWNTVQQAYERYWLKNTDRKWYTAGATPVLATNVIVGAGRGFWYNNKNTVAFNWVEARPYSL